MDKRLIETFEKFSIDPLYKDKLDVFLNLLKKHSVYSYQHCIRVALLCTNIGDYLHIDSKALFYAGLLHDLGKYNTSTNLLNKRGIWTTNDKILMRSHVLDAYDLLKGTFDFTAEVIVWHHKFQSDSYPEIMPTLLHNYSEKTQDLIKYYGRLVAIADVYDALHRKNNRFGKIRNLNKAEIKEQMLLTNKDVLDLIEDLYIAGIFN